MVTDVATLLSMSQSQLDDLFRSSESGPIPDGAAKGTAIIAPGTAFTPELADIVTHFVLGLHGRHDVLLNLFFKTHLTLPLRTT